MKKIKIRLTIGKEHANYCITITDLLRQRKVVKVGLKNIISYYQITEVFKLVLSIRQHAGSKNYWTTKK